MKGQLIRDWETTHFRWVEWVKGPIKIARKELERIRWKKAGCAIL